MKISRLEKIRGMELMKLTSKLNYVFTMVAFTLISLQLIFSVRVEMEGMVSVTHKNIYELAWKYIDNMAFTFLPVLLLINVGKEFEYAVVQRTLVSGFSRGEYFIGKLFQLFVFSVYGVAGAWFFTSLTSLAYELPYGYGDGRLLLYFPVSFCLCSFALLLVLLLRKTLYALGTFIVYVFLESILHSIGGGKLYDLLPFRNCINILRHDIFGQAECIALVLYSVIFVVWGWRRFLQMDLQ
jgi:hypothetical protein